MNRAPMTAGMLEKSIFWQNHVIRESRDPVQIARCREAVKRLTAQLDALYGVEDDTDNPEYVTADRFQLGE